MGLRISTNVASIAAQNQLVKSQMETQKAMKELASGSRLSNISSDAAGKAIAEELRGQFTGLKAARVNANNASSFIQVAEGSLNEQNNILIRLRELSVQAASDTNSDTERGFLDQEYQQLTQEFDRIAKTTKFGSTPLLDGSKREYEFQVGSNKGYDSVITFNNDLNTTASGVSIDGLRITEKSDARDSLESLDSALKKVAESRAKLGAVQSRLESVDSHLSTQIEGIENAYSQRNDTDVADAVSRMTRGTVLMQYQAAVLTKANQLPEVTLKLIA